MFVSIGFAIIFNSPKRSLWAVAVLGGIGYSVRAILLSVTDDQMVFSTIAATSTVGFLGVYFAHKVHTPPTVFTIPAVINIIPGKPGYECMIGLIDIMTLKNGETLQFEAFFDTFAKGIKTGVLLLTLAFGVAFPILIFKTKTIKEKDLFNLFTNRLNRPQN